MKKYNYDYMYDRTLVNRRVIMFFNIYNNITKKNDPCITPVDLCLGLYSDNIDPLNFIKELKIEDYTSEKNIMIKMGAWLNDNHTIYWLVTCAAVDELLDAGKIRYNKAGYLELTSEY